MHSANKTRTTQLCDALTGVGLQLTHSECAEVLSKLRPGNTNSAQHSNSNDDQRRAELFVDQLYEAMFEPNYTKMTKLFEEKFLIHMSELEFYKDMQKEQELLGAYFGREYMGGVKGTIRVGDDRYPNLVRHFWRCFFEKNETLLRVGIYEKDGTHYVSGVNFV